MTVAHIGHRDEVAVGIGFARRTGRKTDTEHECLLQDEHQYRRQHRRSIAALGVEQRHVAIVER